MATGGRTKYDPTKMMPGPSRTAQMDDSVSFYVDGCVVYLIGTKTYFHLETIAVGECFMVFLLLCRRQVLLLEELKMILPYLISKKWSSG
jgi:hypothetical protein